MHTMDKYINLCCIAYFYAICILVTTGMVIYLNSTNVYEFTNTIVADAGAMLVVVLTYVLCISRLLVCHKSSLNAQENKQRKITMISITLLFGVLLTMYGYVLYGMYVVLPSQYTNNVAFINGLTYDERLTAIKFIVHKEDNINVRYRNSRLETIRYVIVSQ